MAHVQEAPVTASWYLRRKIGLVLPALVDASERVCTHPRVRELYPEYLITSHCIIRASVPLMEAGRERAQALADDDPLAAELAPYYEHHIPEELHHDDWLLDDLEVLGRDRSEVLSRIPAPTVAALVGAQYYWMFHYHPVALLGYIAVLEGYPPTPELVDDLVAGTGYDPSAFRTVLAHAELDPGHSAELDELLDSLPLTREQSGVVGLSAMTTVELYARALDEVVDEYGGAG
jgi:Iron-containing redox enzyme